MVESKSWWQRLWSKPVYNPTLPDVPLYGGKAKSQFITSEYPSDKQVHTDHLQIGFPYQRLDVVLSPVEQTLYKQLYALLHNQGYLVLPKMRLADVLSAPNMLSDVEKKAANERLRPQKIDFVLCASHDFSLQGVILLESPLGEAKFDTQAHQRFVTMALANSGVRTLHLSTQEKYSYQTLRTQLQAELGIQFSATFAPSCPRCLSAMKKITVPEGTHAGQKVWLCRRHPHCKGILKA